MLLVILSHRIFLILTIVTGAVQVILPRALTQSSDISFLEIILRRSQYVVLTGLFGLVATGLLRLQVVIPELIVLKMIIAGVTVTFSFSGRYYLPISKFHFIQLILLLLTASTGLLI